MKIGIGSMNPVKINCVRQAFEEMMEGEMVFIGIDVNSSVSDQPLTNEETLLGAENRAKDSQLKLKDAEFWVGIEGGVENTNGGMEAFAWVVILSKEKKGISRTATFMLPLQIAELVNQGVELGHADDQIFKRKNSKQKDGAIGILTNGKIDRTAYYKPAVTMAMIPFLHQELY
ncbi:MAG: inosine/xanthosine triphosphatase [Reichenbachiella sp.]